MTTPYLRQSRHQFWRPVTKKGPDGWFQDLYKPSLSLALADGRKVATAGSCFAQNIRAELIKRGLHFLDCEPSPDLLAPQKRGAFGYDLFSARFGNIYSAAQLRQSLDRAYGIFTPADDVWEDNGRFYDPFRPTIEPSGFASLDELHRDRDHHFSAVRTLVEDMDVFIFTLGLTEIWRNKRDHAVYPLCPGSTAGRFDESLHVFETLRVSDIVADMAYVFDFCLKRNPACQFILTVSPVPLVATGGQYHVVTATTESKSILRAAAGELADRFACVDYFPSYELFTSPLSQGRYFQEDQRNPTVEGVSRAMDIFFTAHGMPPGHMPIQKSDAPDHKQTAIDQFLEEQYVICDEMALDVFPHD